MGESRSFATLSSGLLAGKGRARPAMRRQSQLFPSAAFGSPIAVEDDLGWNDMGEDDLPEVVRQREEITRRLTPVDDEPAQAPSSQESAHRSSGLASARRAAFTLRLDPDRHLRLRLASTLLNQSAQVIVTEALDRYLEQVPEVAELAGKVRRRRN